MPTIEARGYVRFPEAKSGSKGTFSKFQLGVKQKEKAWGDKPETVTYANFGVSDFHNSSPPEEGAYVTVKGFLKVREVEKDGSKRTFLDIITSEGVEVAPPLDGNSGQAAPTGGSKPKAKKAKASAKVEKQPWEDEEIPF